VLPICFPIGIAAAPGDPVKLTQTSIARLALPAGKSDAIFFDDDLPGFGIRIRAGGKRTWLIQYRIGAKQRRLSIGDVKKVSADTARRAAKNRLARGELGYDPQQEKHDTRAAAGQTVGRLVEDYLARRHYQSGKDPLRRSSYEATALYLQKHWRPLHTMRADKVDRSAVASRVSAIEAEISSVTAARARVALQSMFGWAVGQGIVTSNPVIGVNKPPEPKARDRVLTDSELAEIWAACRDDDFGRIVRLLALSGQRRDEIGDLSWHEIDLDKAAITLPPERTKNGRTHIVPLASAALEILRTAPRRARKDGANDFVFGEGEGGYSGWSKAKVALDRRINDARAIESTPRTKRGTKPQPIPDWRLHDLRRTCATRLADLGVLPHVIEAMLNHVSGHKSGVAGVYNRSAYEREVKTAVALWDNHLHSIVNDTDRKVIPLRAPMS
jgi:integrase